MVYIVVKSFFPTHKNEEVSARNVEMMAKFPPDNTLVEAVVPLAARASKEGIEAMGINLIKEGKFDEALIRIGRAMAMFNDIEGFEYSVETWVTLEEVMAMRE
ncbi:MAG: hypothetical protein ACXABO_12625 [Promethearchaeota archaeon]|jgi:U3 small nucleolar ribonucleoprotein component